jgi:SAM-dependent methyltransferase
VGYVFRIEDTERFENWFQSEPGRSVFTLERDLLSKVWEPVSSQRVLQVGCGSGIFLEWFASNGHIVAGIDPANSSLELARKRMGGRIPLSHGFAENLPFDDNEFDTVALITSLEFVDDPFRALSEAFRVARRNVLIGATNKYSIGHIRYFIEKFWKDSPYRHARFFSIFELRRMTGRILSGEVPIEWRTCIAFPISMLRYVRPLERSSLLQGYPFGQFIAMRIDMRNRFRTLQTPVFSEIPSGVPNASFRSFCWRSPRGQEDLRC